MTTRVPIRLPRRLALALACLVGLGAAHATAQTNLTYTNYLPPSHASNRYALEPLFKALEQETDGRVKVTLQPGGALVDGRGTLAALRDGLADGGFVVSIYAQNELPMNAGLSDLAFYMRDPLSVTGAVNEMVLLHCPQCLAEYKKYKVVYFGAYSTTPYKLMCTKPVRSLADVKGLKLRAPGSALARWATRIQAIPVNIENAEAYEAMQRGQIDCVLGSVAWLETLSLGDVAKFVLDLSQGGYFGGALIAMNADSWAKLSPDDKKAFVKLVPTYLAKLAIGYVHDDERVLERAKGKGVTLLKPDQAIQDALAAHRAAEFDEAVATAKKRGVANPEPTLRTFLDLLKKWERIVDETGTDDAKYEAALRREIYDKAKF